MEKPHHVVIIGGGFAGLNATRSLAKTPFQVTLIDRRNFHLFQPLLYQVATGSLSPANIASPLRVILNRQKNARVLLAEVIDIDLANRSVILTDGKIGYDTLIIATGSRHHYFGHDDWEPLAPGLKTIEDATEMRSRIFLAFEAAERESDPVKVRGWLTFVIVGGGPTGVELAGALGEIVNDVLKHDFRQLNPADVRILLVEGDNRILPPYRPTLSSRALFYLARLGVTVRMRAVVTDIQPGAVTIRSEEKPEVIPCRTVLWAAGVRASSLGAVLAAKTGAKLDRSGRVIVEPDLSLPNHPEIFAIGDLANYPHQTGQPLPGVATVAIQQGRYVATLLRNRIRGKETNPFRFKNLGSMAIIGRAAAVAEFGRIHCAGFGAWLIWLFVHLVQLIEFENRLLVLVQWAWYYFTRSRAARLITGETLSSIHRTQTEDKAGLTAAGAVRR
jgi:NADH dehydrogenase